MRPRVAACAMRAWRLAWTMAAASAVLLAGCLAPQDAEDRGAGGAAADLGSPECPGHGLVPSAGGASQTGVSNTPGAFSYGGRAVAKTGTEVYLWQNPSSGAFVQWGGQTATGTLSLVVQDECGSEVYRKEFGAMQQDGGQEASARGAPGEWAITLEFAAYTGQVGLQVTSG
jgi:hypothetical protein